MRIIILCLSLIICVANVYAGEINIEGEISEGISFSKFERVSGSLNQFRGYNVYFIGSETNNVYIFRASDYSHASNLSKDLVQQGQIITCSRFVRAVNPKDDDPNCILESVVVE